MLVSVYYNFDGFVKIRENNLFEVGEKTRVQNHKGETRDAFVYATFELTEEERLAAISEMHRLRKIYGVTLEMVNILCERITSHKEELVVRRQEKESRNSRQCLKSKNFELCT